MGARPRSPLTRFASVPVAPIAAAQQLIDGYRNGETGHASFSLPFGIRANVFTGEANGAGTNSIAGGNHADRASHFRGSTLARQIRMKAVSDFGMPGNARQTNNIQLSAFGPSINAPTVSVTGASNPVSAISIRNLTATSRSAVSRSSTTICRATAPRCSASGSTPTKRRLASAECGLTS